MKFPDSQFCFWYLVFALAILFISDLKYCLCFTTAMTQVSMHLHFVTTSVISTDSDNSASSTTEEAELDKRIQELVDMEDPDILTDLRCHNGSKESQFNVFRDYCEQFLNENVSVAVDDRRIGQITHLARAISLWDFRDQVKSFCPENTPKPSLEWLRLQF
uniref:Uncharacterized protein n=1 Tax=Amphimedon queenslandica TaxID=400682 RepID=A0A1X7VMB1_AMPQE